MSNELRQAIFIATLGMAALIGMLVVFLTNFN